MQKAIGPLVILLLLTAWSDAAAQCSALVRDGVFETFSVSSENVSVNAFMNWVRDHRSSSSSSSTGGGISIPVIGSLNGSSEQYAQLESDYAAMNSGSSAARQRLITHARSVSATLAQRFNECMAIKGLHVWLETTRNPKVFRVAAVFNSPGPGQVRSLIHDVDLSSLDVNCNGIIQRGTRVFGSTKRMRCTRDTDDAVAVTINADSDPIGGDMMELAEIPVPAPPPTMPRCDSQAMVSRRALASSDRLTDGHNGPNDPGQNSGAPAGTVWFWVELPQPEWIHHLVLYPFTQGTPGTNIIKGEDSSGQSVEIGRAEARAGSAPIVVYTDPFKSRNIKKVLINTQPFNPAAFVAWTEIEVFVCR